MRLPIIKGLFHRLSDTQGRMLRNSHTDLRIPLFKTSSGQKRFEFRRAPIWNNLSNGAKRSSTFCFQAKIMKISLYNDATMAACISFRPNFNFLFH